jgi:hypothetical protein
VIFQVACRSRDLVGESASDELLLPTVQAAHRLLALERESALEMSSFRVQMARMLGDLECQPSLDQSLPFRVEFCSKLLIGLEDDSALKVQLSWRLLALEADSTLRFAADSTMKVQAARRLLALERESALRVQVARSLLEFSGSSVLDESFRLRIQLARRLLDSKDATALDEPRSPKDESIPIRIGFAFDSEFRFTEFRVIYSACCPFYPVLLDYCFYPVLLDYCFYRALLYYCFPEALVEIFEHGLLFYFAKSAIKHRAFNRALRLRSAVLAISDIYSYFTGMASAGSSSYASASGRWYQLTLAA